MLELPVFIDANPFSPELGQFRFCLQDDLTRGWESCGIFRLISEGLGGSDVWLGAGSV